MPRLNGRLQRGPASNANENGGLLSQKVTFFGMVGAVMTALKLKEQWDSYKQVPAEPNSANPLAAPPAYRDEVDEENEIGLTGPALDTEIPAPTRKTKRERKCCVCCGLNCGLFCKALGIVVLIFIAWNTIKLIKWAVTPAPTGLEGMPEYSKSLGCLNAPHFYDDTELIYYTLPIGIDQRVEIQGGAVGTIVLAPSKSADDNTVKVQASLRTNEKSLFESTVLSVHTTTDGAEVFSLASPVGGSRDDACMRFDLTVFVPPNVRSLSLTSHSVTQVKFSEDFGVSPRMMGDLRVTLTSGAEANLLLPSTALTADNTALTMAGGYLVGQAAVANSTRISTADGSAVAKLTLGPSAYHSTWAPALLTTTTGTGRADFSYENTVQRTITSEHMSLGNGDMYLTYAKAHFNGQVVLSAASYTARGLQGMAGPGATERWAGDKNGADTMKVSSKGWVGLYF